MVKKSLTTKALLAVPAIILLSYATKINAEEDHYDDDESGTTLEVKNHHEKSTSPTAAIVVAVVFFVIAMISIVVMIIVLLKYRKARKALSSSSKKVNPPPLKAVNAGGAKANALPRGGAGSMKLNQSQTRLSLQQKKIPPKEIKIAGKGGVGGKASTTTTGSGKTTTTSTTTKKTIGTPKSPNTETLPSGPKKLKGDLAATKQPISPVLQNVDPTQSSYLEPNHDLKAKPFNPAFKTFVCFDGDDWHEPLPGEIEDFSFEIESGNTFSMISK